MLPALTYAYAGLVNGDSASVFSGAMATAATAGASVGSYAITQARSSAGPNYDIGFTSGTLTVNPAPLSVSADNLGKTYGGGAPR